MSRGGNGRGSFRASKHKGLARKLFVIAFVAVNVLSIALMPAQPALAASFTFTQNDWAASADTNATAAHTSGAAATGVTSFYSTSSPFLTTGADLAVATSSGSFAQTNWTTVNQTTTASHTSNQTGWTSASTTDSQIDYTGTPGSLKLTTVSGSVSQTNDGVTTTGFNLSGNVKTNTQVTGTGTSASVALDGAQWTQTSNPTAGGDNAHVAVVNGTDLYVAGREYVSSTNHQWRIEKRDLTTGALITAFGTNGVVTEDPSASVDDIAALAIDGTGLYVGGYDMSPGDTQWRIEKRDLTTGALITAFGTNGVVTVNPSTLSNDSGYDTIHALAVDGTGLYVGGRQRIGPAGSGNAYKLSAWRIEKRDLTTGALITAFGTSGVVTVDIQTGSDYGNDAVNVLAIDGTGLYAGGIAWVGGAYSRIEKRDLTTGALITAFGTNGVISSALVGGFTALALDGTGLYAGSALWSIEKRNPTTGALITAFGTNGVVTVDPTVNEDGITALALSSTGLYAGGYENFLCDCAGGEAVGTNSADSKWRIERRNPTTGALDTAFGTNGVFTYNPTVGNDNDRLRTLVSVSGGIVAGGYGGGGGWYEDGNADWRILRLRGVIAGTYTSGIIDLGTAVDFTTVSWVETLNGQTLTMKVRSCDDSACSGETAFASITQTVCTTGCTIGQNGALNTLTSVVDGHQYVQYQVTLSTADTSVTPTLDSITINAQSYPVVATGYALVSSPFNTEDSVKGISSVSWNGATTSAASLKFQVRTASSLAGLTSAAWCGPANCSGTDYFVDANNGSSIANTALTDGSNDQWFQYKAILTTTNSGATPTLNDVTVAYRRALDSVNGYTLISSPYDSGSNANVIGDVRMNVTALPAGTSAKIQVRTAATSGGLTSATWCGTDCTGSTYFTATGTGTNTFTAGTNDQWFQYRITLIPSSDNLSAPTVASVGVTYVVNTAPTVTNVTATTAATTQGASGADAGKVTVTYDLTDDASETTDTYEAYLFYDVGVTLTSDNTTTLTVSDTSKMPSSGYVQIGTEVVKYGAIVNGTTLGTLTRGASDLSWPGSAARHTKAYTPAGGTVVWVKAGAVTGAVGSVTKGTGKTMVWDQRSESQFANYSKYDAKVRVLVHDNNLANQLSSQSGSSTDSTNNVIIDNLAPTFSFTFDAGVAGQTDSATVNMSTSGPDATSTAQYMIADDAATHSSASSTAWTTFTTPGTRAWTFDSDFEIKTVKVQVRDPYANTAATSTASTIMPAAAGAFLVQDVSKIATSDWRLFVGWETATSSSFASYKIEYATSTDNTIYSSYVNATTPITVISTNYYVHQNLNTNWYYRYRLGVTAANGNTSIRSNASTTAKPDGSVNFGEGGGGNTPPTITNVASSALKATSVNISFDATNPTSGATNAAVYFATQADFTNNVSAGKVDRERYTTKIANSGYITAGANVSSTHTVVLTNLLKNTVYRYAVESCSAAGDCRFEDFSDAGYDLQTQNGPAVIFESISATPAYDSAVITWKTDKASDSIVFYATTSASTLINPITVGSTAQITSADGNWQYVHTVHIPSLTPSTTYYYKVRSTDQNSSSGTYTQYDESTIRSFTTIAPFPPTITTAAACSTTDRTVTVTWGTDQLSTTEVSMLSADVSGNYFSTTPGAQVAQYPTGTINDASRALVDFSAQHEHTFNGLTEVTTYYLKVRSLNRSGGEVSSTLSCRTLETPKAGSPPSNPLDTTKPLISSLVIKDIKATSATIAWTTDESADSLVKYGVTMNYGGLGGSEEMTTDHTVTVSGLNPQTAYNFKVMSADQRGNRAYSGDQTFTTLSVQEEALLAKEDLESLKKELEELRGKAKTQESLKDAVQRFKSILKSVSTDVSLQDLEDLTTEITDTISEITQEVVPPAIIGGVPQVDIDSNKATITWRTNKPAGSLIALVQQEEYDPNAKDPYTVQVGQPREEVTTHVVTVPNLEPATTYHFQIRSQAKVGPEGKSRDFVFETKPELPQILDYSFKRITENSITVAWKTNTLSNSQVRYTPFDDGELLNKEAKTQGKPEFVKDHEVTVANLPSNTNFLIEIASADVTDATASKVIGTIRTTVDEKAPVISKVRSESTIFPGKTERTQTLIYWETDEPSTSQIFWKEGVGKGDLLEFSKLDQEYTTSHVMVITSFKPGAVYRFQVESADPSNNKGRSTDFTILTPKKGETVIDLIITNFQDIFGFLKQL